jgi:hypothetical protein
MSNYPQYHVIEIITAEPVQLPGAIVASGVNAFVIEQQTLATTGWIAATMSPVNALQAYYNLLACKNIYIVGQPWGSAALASAAAYSDYLYLAAARDGAVSATQLQGQITTSAYANLITTVAGPG